MNDWLWLAILAILVIFYKTVLPKATEEYIKHQFASSLEEHKHKLNSLSDTAKFEYQRKLADFNYFAAKKHEHYGGVFSLITEAKFSVFRLRGAYTMPSFAEHNCDDIRRYLEQLVLPEGKIEEIVSWWNAGEREQAIREIRHYIRIKRYRTADSSIGEAYKAYYAAKLFLSNEVDEMLDGFLDDLNNLYSIYETTADFPDAEMAEEARTLREKLESSYKDLCHKMKTEMATGYYENTPN